MFIRALVWLLMAGSLLTISYRLPRSGATLCWAGFVAVMIGASALALRMQPIGRATLTGRLGSTVLRWGFRAGQGRLWPAALISWLVWLLIGAGVMAVLNSGGDATRQLLILAWMVDVLAIFHLLGLLLARRGGSRSFLTTQLTVVAALLAMVVFSAVLSRATDSPASQRLALTIAGGPPLLIGGGYGLFLLVMVTVGRRARWN